MGKEATFIWGYHQVLSTVHHIQTTTFFRYMLISGIAFSLALTSGCHHSQALYDKIEYPPLEQGRLYEQDYEYAKAEEEYLQIDNIIVRDMTLNQLLSAWNNVNANIAYAQRIANEQPHSAKAHLRLADEYYKKGLLCARYTSDVVGNYPKDFIMDEQNFFYREALQHVQRALNIRKHYPEAHLLLSELYLMLSRQDDALNELRILRITHPNLARTYYAIAKIYFDMKAYGKVERYLIRALKLDPTLQDAYYLLGKFYLEQEWFEWAAYTFLESLRRQPSDSPALELLLESCYQLGRFYVEQEQYDKAIKLFLAMNNVKPSYKVHQSLVNARRKQGEAAVHALEAAENQTATEIGTEPENTTSKPEEATF